MNDKLVKTSKYLSKILRHDPGKINLVLDAHGWADISELLAKSGMKISQNLLEEVVATNNKKRFAISEDGTRIRASQGHSVKVDLGYEAAEPPLVLYHGTAEKNLAGILDQGLIKRNRHHVHLSADEHTAQNVGARHGKPVILAIDVSGMLTAGHEFFVSANGVWLTDHVPAEFLSQ